MNDDLKELLRSLQSHDVEFLVIGAHALARHGVSRYTEDVNIWVRRSVVHAERLRDALADFGTPIGEDGARRFSQEDRQMIRLGSPPQMVDILNFAGSKPFEEVYARKVGGLFMDLDLDFPSLEDLIEMKKASGRPQDLVDVAKLESLESKNDQQ